MKRSMKRLLSVLLACVLLLVPAVESAASSYDLASGTIPDALFPGESLSGVTPGTLTVDGTPADTPEGTWTNNESGKVYSAAKDDAGNYSLTFLGYTLTVKGGSSEGGAGVHRVYSSGEDSDETEDVSCCMPGDQVVIKAADPAEGKQFSGWTVEAPDSGISLDDPSQPEQTITIPDVSAGVVITARYVEVQNGEIQPVEASDEEGPSADTQSSLYTLTVNNGSGSGEYAAGAQVSVTADDRSGEGLQFAGWDVENWWSVSLEDSTAATVVFTMPEENATLTAQYMQTAVSEYPDDGSVPGQAEGFAQDLDIELSGQDSDPAYDQAGSSAQNSGDGLSQNIGLPDASGSSADVWIDGGDVNGSGDLWIEGQEATPADEAAYLLTVENSAGTAEYAAGTAVRLTADDKSGEGLQFTGWTTDSSYLTLDDPSQEFISFVMPAASLVLTANYAEASQQPDVYPVSVEYGTGSGEYAPGTRVVITANDRSAEGLLFNGWAVTSLNAALEDLGAAETAFEMPAAAVAISAGYTEASGLQAADETESETPQTEPETLTEAPQTESEAPTEAPQTESEAPTEAPQTNEPQTESEAPTEAPQTNEPQTESETSTEEQVYKLTVENGRGGGEYPAGAIVAIEANEQKGMTFAGWVSYNDKAVISDPSKMVTTLVMPAEDVAIAADYVTVKYKVVLNYGNGNRETSKHVPGETVKVSAPDRESENLQFAYWTGTQEIAGTSVELRFADSKAAETTFVMPEGKVKVTANYTPLPATYHVTVSNGLINGSYKELDCEEGDSITVAANPGPEGQQFSRWVVNDGKVNLGDQAYSSSVKVSVTEDMNFLAVYEGIEYKVTVNYGTADYQECTSGTTVTIQANDAEAGMTFDHWEVNAGSVSLADASQSQTTFTMPASDVGLTAYYRKAQYQLVVENGTSDAQYYYMGDKVTVSSSYPASGRVFDGWTSDGGNVEFADSSRAQTTFTMPASNVVVRAAYADGPSPDSNKIQNIDQGGQYYTGDTIEFTASGAGMDNTNPNPGDYRYRPASYQIGSVTGTWQGAPYSTSMAINAAGEYTLKVIYNRDVYTEGEWKPDGTVDTKSVTFRVDSGRTSVETGDETPIGMVVGILVASGLVFIVLLVLFLRRKRR